VADLCGHFQLDLSCLVDGELEDMASARAMLHLEECDLCRGFFEDTRRCVRLHKDVSDPDRLMARIAALTGSDLAAEAAGIDLAHRLATIFYQLGKAYTLAAIDPGFRERIFESTVPVDEFKTRGRGFVDGVLASGGQSAGASDTQTKGDDASVDWQHARHLLNGRLERITDPLEKGKRLLQEALTVDPEHEEARLYVAFVHAHEGRNLRAAEEYRAVFDRSVSDVNRGLAAIQLGRLHSSEDNFSRAIACFRWVTITGLADRDDRFWFARFNLGQVYARRLSPDRSLNYFRELLDKHPTRVGEVAEAFARSPRLRETIDTQPGFGQALFDRCPELFRSPAPDAPHSPAPDAPHSKGQAD
jgi:tetratricopeptide (TPR) repeat protein